MITGSWSLSTWLEDDKGNDVELDDTDLEHIASLVKEGYTSGEIIHSD